MASQNRFLANWVRGAYGMELGLAPMLEQQTSRLDDDTELHKSLTLHLESTRRHASLLAERLQRMGEDLSAIRPIDPVTTSLGHANGGKPDAPRQVELLNYVAENFEVASYRALQSLAELLGDHDTSRVCEQILADEVIVSEALNRRLEGYQVRRDTRGAASEGNVLLAREVFAALNAHAIELFDKLVSKDYRAALPGDSRPVDREVTRAWLEAFFNAFPDMRYELHRVAGSGESVFVEWTATGTHRGPLPTVSGGAIPASGNPVKITGVAILRFENGKFTHAKIVSDGLSLMRQIRAAPGDETFPESAAAAASGPTAEQGSAAGREIVHLEIPASDPDATARFYGDLFGWQYRRMGEPANYTTFQAGTLSGGFPNVSETNPAGLVTLYVDSEDIESDLRRASWLGGRTIVPRTEIPGYGEFAILCDPSGNRFGLYHVEQGE